MMNNRNGTYDLLLLGALFCELLFCESLWSQSSGTPWKAADRLGRVIAQNGQTGEIRPEKTIALFYFLWNSPASNIPKAPYLNGPYDISKIFQIDPDVMKKDDSPLWAKDGQFHYWGEPLYGYYYGNDPWVMRRHIHLLADAGIDLLIFDTTNALIYQEVLFPFLDMLHTVRAEGDRTPLVTFMLNTKTSETAERLWKQVYATEKYNDLLFRLEEKPLLVADPSQIKNQEILNHLTFRKAHWPTKMVNTQNAWHWEAAYPQPYSWNMDPKIPEQINVSVAQNLNRTTALVENMSSGLARGRSFRQNQKADKALNTEVGLNFAQQWERVYELDPSIVMITGWNEWIAGRWPREGGHVFVDQFDREYSRDIEPMKGGHLDNYYLQMIDGIRRFKGTEKLPEAPKWKTIDINGDFSQWKEVQPEFRDHINEIIPREHSGAAGLWYENHSGRNDLVSMKYTRDEECIYFYLKTKEDIMSELPFGLCLLIDTDGDLTNGWIGADYLIGRTYKSDMVSLERFYNTAPGTSFFGLKIPMKVPEKSNRKVFGELPKRELDKSVFEGEYNEISKKPLNHAFKEESDEKGVFRLTATSAEDPPGLLEKSENARWSSERLTNLKQAPETDPVWRWRSFARVRWRMLGNEFHLAIPVTALELEDPQCDLDKISFKWLDNFKTRITPGDLYVTGDVAPESRFFYSTAPRQKKISNNSNNSNGIAKFKGIE